MIERLKSEHRSFESKIVEVQGNINNNDIAHTTEIVRSMTDKVTHHAIEEVRLMRVEKYILTVHDYLTYNTMDLRSIFDTIMNMDQRIRFVGVLDKNATIIEGGMRKNVSSLLHADKDDLFYLRALSHLKELEDFKNALGGVKYIYIQMDKVSFVIMNLKNGEEEEENSLTLLVSMEPDMNPSFIVPSIRNVLIE